MKNLKLFVVTPSFTPVDDLQRTAQSFEILPSTLFKSIVTYYISLQYSTLSNVTLRYVIHYIYICMYIINLS